MTEEGFYFAERFTDNIIRNIKVERIRYEGKTSFQYVQIFDNKILGKTLFLDKKIQSAGIDEFVFHEVLVHPALLTHRLPQRVLIIGGGEGATLREVCRHDCVQRATMVDIDKELVLLCREHLPEWSAGAFSNPKVRVVYSDAWKYAQKCKQKFDVIVSDLTEPVEGGPSVKLFTQGFFAKLMEILEDDGVLVIQAGSTDLLYNRFFASCARTLEQVFPFVRPYWTFMFSFCSPWGFIIASRKEDPLKIDEKIIKKRFQDRKIKGLKFYHLNMHHGLFALPLYLQGALKKGRILTQKDPFIWDL